MIVEISAEMIVETIELLSQARNTRASAVSEYIIS